MDAHNLGRQLVWARRSRNVMMIFVAIGLAANLMLAVKVFNQSNQVVLVPSMVAGGMVARGTVDRSYIEALAKDAVYSLYNMTPANLHYQRQAIETLASVNDRIPLLTLFDETATDIRERKISTIFVIERIEKSPDGLEVRVIGKLRTFVEEFFSGEETRTIVVRFRPEAGSVRVSSIGRV